MLCPLSYWSLGVNNCLINQFMIQLGENHVIILCTITNLRHCKIARTWRHCYFTKHYLISFTYLQYWVCKYVYHCVTEDWSRVASLASSCSSYLNSTQFILMKIIPCFNMIVDKETLISVQCIINIISIKFKGYNISSKNTISSRDFAHIWNSLDSNLEQWNCICCSVMHIRDFSFWVYRPNLQNLPVREILDRFYTAWYPITQ